MSVLVPPTSKKIPFETLKYIKAPTVEAAGPDSIVSTGLFLISSMSITPPSPLIIISGALIPAFLTADSVLSAVSNILGNIEAFITAVLVLLVSPYNLLISDAAVTSIPLFAPNFLTSNSSSILSTPKVLVATNTLQFSRNNSSIVSLIFAELISFKFIYLCAVVIFLLPESSN